MSVIYNRRTFGLFKNGCFQDASNTYFTNYGSTYTADSLSNGTCIRVGYNKYGITYLGEEYIPIDTSKTYQFAVSAKTVQNNYLGHPGSGYPGFSCYDKSFNFIDLRHCGGIGNTTLSRALNVGDSYVYITSSSGWYTNPTPTAYYFSQIGFYPASHPDYSTPYRYTRLSDYYYNPRSIALMPEGDYRLTLTTIDYTTPTTWAGFGYPTPAGTPVCNMQAGGTYNYALGALYHPSSWTTYITPPFTGESRNSAYPFRYGTKYIQYMDLVNYLYSSENSGAAAEYLIDNIILVEVPPGKTYSNTIFSLGKTYG